MKTIFNKVWELTKLLVVTTFIVVFTYLFNFFFVALAVGFAHYIAVPLLLKMGVPLELAWLAVMLTFIRVHFARVYEHQMRAKQQTKRMVMATLYDAINNANPDEEIQNESR